MAKSDLHTGRSIGDTGCGPLGVCTKGRGCAPLADASGERSMLIRNIPDGERERVNGGTNGWEENGNRLRPRGKALIQGYCPRSTESVTKIRRQSHFLSSSEESHSWPDAGANVRPDICPCNTPDLLTTEACPARIAGIPNIAPESSFRSIPATMCPANHTRL